MRRRAPVFALFFLAPFVAEFLLGDFPIFLLPLIIPLAPMYGGGALLIRELTRRAGRGWPTMITLAVAFGVLEEGLLTQSLFNRGYLDQHLLDPGYIPALGTAAPWALYVVTLHTLWSISTPVALVEESTNDRRTQPWLGNVGLTVVALLFTLGCAFTFFISYAQSKTHFIASLQQLGVAAAIVVVLVAVAFRLPAPKPPADRHPGPVPNPWLVLATAIVAGVAFEAATAVPIWAGLALMLGAVVVMALLVARWGRRAAWGRWHRFALATGAVLTDAWHSFALGADARGAELVLNLVSHAIFALVGLGVVWLAGRRIRRPQTVAAAAPANDNDLVMAP